MYVLSQFTVCGQISQQEMDIPTEIYYSKI